MAEDHGAPEAGQLSRAWTRGRKRQRVAKEREAQKVYSRTEQNEMRDVLERVPAGVARRIFDSANPREIRAQQ